MEKKTFYTDGACLGNPGSGGWAYVELVPCKEGYKTKVVTGNKNGTTNNEMELTAVYMAVVNAMKAGCKSVVIHSDSAYVVNAIGKGWLKGWGRSGWKTKEGKEVKNLYIWEKLYKIIYEKNVEVRMVYVKSHNGDVLNELADESAVQARKQRENEV